MAIWPELDPHTDNVASIQEGIDEATGSGGGEVLIANGRWPIERPLRISARVALRGESLIGSVLLLGDELDGPAIRIESPPGSPAPLEGVALEDLTLDGDTEGSRRRGAGGVSCDRSLQYCVFRRLRFVELGGPAISIRSGRIDALCIEQIFVEGCSGDGIVLTATEESGAIFITEVVVRDFGRGDRPEGSGSAAIRLGARAMLTQVHVHPVERSDTGIAFQSGSDGSTASNIYLGVRGGTPLGVETSVGGITVEGVLVRDLTDLERERVFP